MHAFGRDKAPTVVSSRQNRVRSKLLTASCTRAGSALTDTGPQDFSPTVTRIGLTVSLDKIDEKDFKVYDLWHTLANEGLGVSPRLARSIKFQTC
jgi:hypothetical protein